MAVVVAPEFPAVAPAELVPAEGLLVPVATTSLPAVEAKGPVAAVLLVLLPQMPHYLGLAATA
jgi:hypothetical protein